MKGFLVALHLNDTKAKNMFVLRTVERPCVGVTLGKSVFPFNELILLGNTVTPKERIASTSKKSLVGSNVTLIIC